MLQQNCSLHHVFAINILKYATNLKFLLLDINTVPRFCWWFLLRDWGLIWFLVINTVFNLSCALQWHCSTDDLMYNNLWKVSQIRVSYDPLLVIMAFALWVRKHMVLHMILNLSVSTKSWLSKGSSSCAQVSFAVWYWRTHDEDPL